MQEEEQIREIEETIYTILCTKFILQRDGKEMK